MEEKENGKEKENEIAELTSQINVKLKKISKNQKKIEDNFAQIRELTNHNENLNAKNIGLNQKLIDLIAQLQTLKDKPPSIDPVQQLGSTKKTVSHSPIVPTLLIHSIKQESHARLAMDTEMNGQQPLTLVKNEPHPEMPILEVHSTVTQVQLIQTAVKEESSDVMLQQQSNPSSPAVMTEHIELSRDAAAEARKRNHANDNIRYMEPMSPAECKKPRVDHEVLKPLVYNPSSITPNGPSRLPSGEQPRLAGCPPYLPSTLTRYHERQQEQFEKMTRRKQVEDARREEKRKEQERKKEEKRRQEEERRKERRMEEERKKEERRKEKERKEEERQRQKEEKERKKKEAEDLRKLKQEEKKIAQQSTILNGILPLAEKNPQPFVANQDYVSPYEKFVSESNELFSTLETLQSDKPSDYLVKLQERLRFESLVNQQKSKKHLKYKLFQFFEDIRPPYYGTWRKKLKKGTGRRNPFEKITGIDYEVDSEAEWNEEVEDAEECLSCDDRSMIEEEEETNDEDLKSFRVPANYLSEGEGESTTDSLIEKPKESKEIRAERMMNRAKAWQESLQKKKRPCQPNILGPCFEKPPQFCENLEIVIF